MWQTFKELKIRSLPEMSHKCYFTCSEQSQEKIANETNGLPAVVTWMSSFPDIILTVILRSSIERWSDILLMAISLFFIVSSVVPCVIKKLLIENCSFSVNDGRTLIWFQYQSLGFYM